MFRGWGGAFSLYFLAVGLPEVKFLVADEDCRISVDWSQFVMISIVEVEAVRIEYGNARLECSAADERAKLLASKVIGLEEKVLNTNKKKLMQSKLRKAPAVNSVEIKKSPTNNKEVDMSKA
ncbi:hypothetical protein Tco_0287745 [Tanacetum coccineum]